MKKRSVIVLGGVLIAVSGAAAFATLAIPTQETSAVSDPRQEPPIVRLVTAAPVTGSERGARTAWHTHPLGQTLIVTAGCGRAQHWGGPIEEIQPGDVVWFPPGEKHWHGATPTTAMTHIAIVERLDGKSADWMEKVTDEQYGA